MCEADVARIFHATYRGGAVMCVISVGFSSCLLLRH